MKRFNRNSQKLFFDVRYLCVQQTHFWCEPFFGFGFSFDADQFHWFSFIIPYKETEHMAIIQVFNGINMLINMLNDNMAFRTEFDWHIH